MEAFTHFLLEFAFIYPLYMSWLWIVGGIYYYFRWESGGQKSYRNPPELESYPGVSVIVPAHNESAVLNSTLNALLKLDYPNYEIIVANDGSTDDTKSIIDAFCKAHPRIRAIHLASNEGKAAAMRMAAISSRCEILVCIDGDAILDKHALRWMVPHFVHGPRVGAVTGNPRIRNRSTLLGKLQVGEFSSIIGLIKRAQRVYGRVFTVSGVVAAFRKSALHQVGYWDLDKITDDIDVSWKLQIDHWSIRFESNALCWILMPETVSGLWKQRLRWAQGGVEVALSRLPDLLNWQQRHMWLVLTEFLLSMIWSYTMLLLGIGFVLAHFDPHSYWPTFQEFLPSWNGALLGCTCLLQFAVSLAIDGRYEKRNSRYYYWIIWYPVAYWMMNVATTVVALPKVLLRKRSARAVWSSPDRGEKFIETTSGH